MTITTYQDIAIDSIEDVMLTVGIVFSAIFRMEAQANKLVSNFFLCGQPGVCNKLLNKHSTYFSITIFGKAYHAIRAGIKVSIMCIDALKERCKVIV